MQLIQKVALMYVKHNTVDFVLLSALLLGYKSTAAQSSWRCVEKQEQNAIEFLTQSSWRFLERQEHNTVEFMSLSALVMGYNRTAAQHSWHCVEKQEQNAIEFLLHSVISALLRRYCSEAIS
jgi:hypothetical protein